MQEEWGAGGGDSYGGMRKRRGRESRRMAVQAIFLDK